MKPATVQTIVSLLVTLAATVAADAGGREAREHRRGWWWEASCRACRGAVHARATPGSLIDPVSGRSLRNYPPHRQADFTAMRLEVEIRDMNVRVLNGTQQLTFTPIGTPLSKMMLHAAGAAADGSSSMEILDVSAPGYRVGFIHVNDEIDIEFTPPVPLGASAQVQVVYRVTDPPEGLHWTVESDAWPKRAAQIHTQGEPESNRYWFPSFDFPTDRLTTELIAHVPKGYTVISNGELVDTGRVREWGGRTFHWRQELEHVSYLVVLLVGKYDSVDVGTRDLPMPVYVPRDQRKFAKPTFKNTADMVELFERLIDEPYPWEKYAQVVVLNFGFGGMENTSATTLFDSAAMDDIALKDRDLDGLIAHELIHQWFGDLITCRSWEHIWLNEGFATYFEHLWFEERDGRDAYEWGILQEFDSVIDADEGFVPEQPAMMSKLYGHPDEIFGRASNPYPKGASVLHMLRMKFGDELFFQVVREYVDRYRNTSVETDHLRGVAEDITGLSLARFFDQWCARPGIPRIEVTTEWDDATGRLAVMAEQTQHIDGANPAFHVQFPVVVRTIDGENFQQQLVTSGREGTIEFELPSVPAYVAVDPMMTFLAEIVVDQPIEQWMELAERGPTLASRIRALRELGSYRDDPFAPIVADILATHAADKREPAGIRISATESLGQLARADLLLELLPQTKRDPRLRRTVIDAFPVALDDEDAPEDVVVAIRRVLKKDKSYMTRAAAVEALGSILGDDAMDDIERALQTDAHHDLIRRGALAALQEIDSPKSVELARMYARAGHFSFTRPAAIRVMGELAHHDPVNVLRELDRYLASHEVRTARAAGSAIVNAALPEGRVVIERHLRRAQGESMRYRLSQWLEELDLKLAGYDPE